MQNKIHRPEAIHRECCAIALFSFYWYAFIFISFQIKPNILTKKYIKKSRKLLAFFLYNFRLFVKVNRANNIFGLCFTFLKSVRHRHFTSMYELMRSTVCLLQGTVAQNSKFWGQKKNTSHQTGCSCSSFKIK